MISVQEAFSVLEQDLPALHRVEYSLSQARKHILAISFFTDQYVTFSTICIVPLCIVFT